MSPCRNSTFRQSARRVRAASSIAGSRSMAMTFRTTPASRRAASPVPQPISATVQSLGTSPSRPSSVNPSPKRSRRTRSHSPPIFPKKRTDPSWRRSRRRPRAVRHPRQGLAMHCVSIPRAPTFHNRSAARIKFTFNQAVVACRAFRSAHEPATVMQRLEVTTHGGLRRLQRTRQFTDTEFFTGQQAQHAKTRGVGQAPSRAIRGSVSGADFTGRAGSAIVGPGISPSRRNSLRSSWSRGEMGNA